MDGVITTDNTNKLPEAESLLKDTYKFPGQNIEQESSWLVELANGQDELYIPKTSLKKGYRIPVHQKSLGEGGQASIFRCMEMETNESYIIKLYDIATIHEQELIGVLNKLEKNTKAIEEADMAYEKTRERTDESNLCRNLAKVYQHGRFQPTENGKTYYYVIMPEYYKVKRELFDFKEVVKADNYLQKEEEFVRYLCIFVAQINKALYFMHKKMGFYHGDIKADNVMYDPVSHKYVIIDFGGGVNPEQIDRSAKLSAFTIGMAATEIAAEDGNITSVWDYRCFGLMLIDMITMTGWTKKQVNARYGGVHRIGAYYVPEALPATIVNLLTGLVFEHEDKDIRKKYRWDFSRVREWLGYMRNGEHEKAEKMSPVLNTMQTAQNTPMNAMPMQQPTQQVDGITFLRPVRLMPVSARREKVYNSLNALMEDFLVNWEWGKQTMLDFPFDEHLLPKLDLDNLRKYCKPMFDVAENQEEGRSLDAEFFKLLYIYIADPSKFFWGRKEFANIHTKEDFGREFYEALGIRTSSVDFFGEWWSELGDADRSMLSLFFEILGNGVLSHYLIIADSTNTALIQQAEKVENIVKKLKCHYTEDELTEFYLLACMLCNKKDYKMSEGLSIFKDYDVFADYMRDLASDKDNIMSILNLKKLLHTDRGLYPAFRAFREMNRR